MLACLSLEIVILHEGGLKEEVKRALKIIHYEIITTSNWRMSSRVCLILYHLIGMQSKLFITYTDRLILERKVGD